MNDIKVGDYVRTKKGYIDKVVKNYKDIKGQPFIYHDYKCEKDNYDEEDIVKYSPNIIDLIEDEDFVVLEYKSPKYKKRITRIFEVSKIDNFISFENNHCDFCCKVGDKKIVDNICKNIKIKRIITKELMQSIEYRVE